jgi:predicted cation transporter
MIENIDFIQVKANKPNSTSICFIMILSFGVSISIISVIISERTYMDFLEFKVLSKFQKQFTYQSVP